MPLSSISKSCWLCLHGAADHLLPFLYYLEGLGHRPPSLGPLQEPPTGSCMLATDSLSTGARAIPLKLA